MTLKQTQVETFTSNPYDQRAEVMAEVGKLLSELEPTASVVIVVNVWEETDV